MTSTTRMIMIDAAELRAAGVKADGRTSLVVEDFGDDWEKEWLVTGKSCDSFRLRDARVPIPPYSKLELSVLDNEPVKLKVSLRDYSVGEYSAVLDVVDGTASLYPFDLKHTKNDSVLMSWSDLPNPLISIKSVTGNLPKLAWKEVSETDFLADRPFQIGEVTRLDGTAILSLDQADRIVGRTETDPKAFNVDKEVVKTIYDQGLQVHSPSEVTYFLKGSFTTFQATIVACYQASVTFEVHGDGEKLYDSGKFGGKSAPIEMAVDVSGVQELKLIVTDGGNGWGGDWAMWANPTLQR